jgi:hypothetical protein
MEIVNIDTRKSMSSIACVRELEHDVSVLYGDELYEAVVTSELDSEGNVDLDVLCDNENVRRHLEASRELAEDCRREWEERFESESCDGY